MKVIANHEGVQITGMPVIKQQRVYKDTNITLFDILTILFILAPVVIGVMSSFARNNTRRSNRGMWWGGGFYNGSSGGFGGFSGGSFGGGGGGSGGGGGASGGW